MIDVYIGWTEVTLTGKKEYNVALWKANATVESVITAEDHCKKQYPNGNYLVKYFPPTTEVKTAKQTIRDLLAEKGE